VQSGTDGTARFEVTDLWAAARLTQRLCEAWSVTLLNGKDVVVVAVAIREEPGDLAALLRHAEAWVAEESLCAIRYELDGRYYVLAAGG
jgi:hypothetical protein